MFSQNTRVGTAEPAISSSSESGLQLPSMPVTGRSVHQDPQPENHAGADQTASPRKEIRESTEGGRVSQKEQASPEEAGDDPVIAAHLETEHGRVHPDVADDVARILREIHASAHSPDTVFPDPCELSLPSYLVFPKQAAKLSGEIGDRDAVYESIITGLAKLGNEALETASTHMGAKALIRAHLQLEQYGKALGIESTSLSEAFGPAADILTEHRASRRSTDISGYAFGNLERYKGNVASGSSRLEVSIYAILISKELEPGDIIPTVQLPDLKNRAERGFYAENLALYIEEILHAQQSSRSKAFGGGKNLPMEITSQAAKEYLSSPGTVEIVEKLRLKSGYSQESAFHEIDVFGRMIELAGKSKEWEQVLYKMAFHNHPIREQAAWFFEDQGWIRIDFDRKRIELTGKLPGKVS